MPVRESILSRITRLYNRSSIRYTVFLSFTLSALVAILLTGVTLYLRFSNQLQSTIHDESRILVEQAKQSLNTYLGNMIRLSDSIDFQVVKNMDAASQTYVEQLQLLYNTNNNYIKNIALFSADGGLVAAAPPVILKSNADVTSEPWFISALGRTENLHFTTPAVQNLFMEPENQYNWIIHLSGSTDITRNRMTEKGVLLIELRYNGISELFKNMSLANNGYVFLMDKDGTIIYHPRHQLLESGLITEINHDVAGFKDGEYTVESGEISNSVIVRTVGYTGWVVVGVIPQLGLNLSGLPNILFMLVILLSYLALTILLNAFISHKLTDPVQKLEQSVLRLESDFEQAKIYEGGPHEIRQLGHSIRQMVDIMRKLTDDIVEEQIQKQKSELNALQAQINPHFLYNTLDILVWMIEKEQPQDALMIVSALAKFFRLSLNKGKNITTVRDELEHIRNYLMIQQMRYKDKFTYTINADDASLGLGTIKLMLQPVVENAIYHGMDFMFGGGGEIHITAEVKDVGLYIRVEDNGLGIPEEKLAALLSERSSESKGSGIGLINVHERIGLYFGKEYGVRIQSELDSGTVVTLHLPAIPYEEMDNA